MADVVSKSNIISSISNNNQRVKNQYRPIRCFVSVKNRGKFVGLRSEFIGFRLRVDRIVPIKKNSQSISAKEKEMASGQQALGSDKHSAKLNELQKIGKRELMTMNLATQSKAVAHAQMWNYTPAVMSFQQNKDWSGTIVGKWPPQIALNRQTSFTHQGVPATDAKGSSGGVIYTGSDQAGGPVNCAFLLAWLVPGDGTTSNKVYVKTGALSQFPATGFNWDTIQKALDASTSDSYYIDDNNTHAEATANISSGNNAVISVTFDIN